MSAGLSVHPMPVSSSSGPTLATGMPPTASLVLPILIRPILTKNLQTVNVSGEKVIARASPRRPPLKMTDNPNNSRRHRLSVRDQGVQESERMQVQLDQLRAEAAEQQTQLRAEAAEQQMRLVEFFTEKLKVQHDNLRAEAVEEQKQIRAEAAKKQRQIRAEAAEHQRQIQAEAAEQQRQIRAEAAEQQRQIRAEAAEQQRQIRVEAAEERMRLVHFILERRQTNSPLPDWLNDILRENSTSGVQLEQPGAQGKDIARKEQDFTSNCS